MASDEQKLAERILKDSSKKAVCEFIVKKMNEPGLSQAQAIKWITQLSRIKGWTGHKPGGTRIQRGPKRATPLTGPAAWEKDLKNGDEKAL